MGESVHGSAGPAGRWDAAKAVPEGAAAVPVRRRRARIPDDATAVTARSRSRPPTHPAGLPASAPVRAGINPG
ncbi:hypothetical protein ACWDOR_13975 [Streptosporangium canum]|uniref:hypothetical protein n=1 Tax=Streptosporangium canum TaxID=324952 RepID=UPI003798BF4D